MAPTKPASPAVFLLAVALLAASCGGSSPTSESMAKPLGSPVISAAPTPTTPVGYVTGVSFVDLQHGWATETLALPGMEPARAGARIVVTSDGGLTWTQQYASQLPLGHIQFVDFRDGWVVEASQLLTTSDGGATWRSLGDIAGTPDFVTSQIGWLTVGRGGIEKTSDGGRTWTPAGTPCQNADGIYVSFATPELGWLLCESGAADGVEIGKILYSTHDGGATWQTVTEALAQNPTPDVLGIRGIVSSMFLLDGTRAWLYYSSPAYQSMRRTKDGGLTWQMAPLPKKTTYTWVNDLHFLDAQHGWMAAAPDSYDPPGQIYATSDGGEMWVPVPMHASTPRADPVASATKLSFSECDTQRDWVQPSLEAVLASPIALASTRAYQVAVHDRHIYLVGPGNSVNRGWVVFSGSNFNPGNRKGACPPITETYPVGTQVSVALIDYKPLEVRRSGDALFVRVEAQATGITNLTVDLSSKPQNLVIYFVTPDDHVILSCRDAGCD